MNKCVEQKGFTLVELLVVMVIVTATTTLLISGFSITWKNFSKLSQRDLMLNSSQIGERWLRESINEAVVFHPEQANFAGDAGSISFTTLAMPWSDSAIPQEITWAISNEGSASILRINYPNQSPELVNFPLGSQFQYQSAANVANAQWQSSFIPNDAELPHAVRIVHQNQVVFYAKLKRPGKADIPPEMIAFGAYEFGD